MAKRRGRNGNVTTRRSEPGARGATRGAAARAPLERRRRRVAPLEDEQPRGFQEDRMRALWREIDRARERAGLGASAAGEAAPAWGIDWLVASAESLVGRAAACVSECSMLGQAAAWLGAVPILGRLVDLIARTR